MGSCPEHPSKRCEHWEVVWLVRRGELKAIQIGGKAQASGCDRTPRIDAAVVQLAAPLEGVGSGGVKGLPSPAHPRTSDRNSQPSP
jgi:hypothetical protein